LELLRRRRRKRRRSACFELLLVRGDQAVRMEA